MKILWLDFILLKNFNKLILLAFRVNFPTWWRLPYSSLGSLKDTLLLDLFFLVKSGRLHRLILLDLCHFRLTETSELIFKKYDLLILNSHISLSFSYNLFEEAGSPFSSFSFLWFFEAFLELFKVRLFEGRNRSVAWIREPIIIFINSYERSDFRLLSLTRNFILKRRDIVNWKVCIWDLTTRLDDMWFHSIWDPPRFNETITFRSFFQAIHLSMYLVVWNNSRACLLLLLVYL